MNYNPNKPFNRGFTAYEAINVDNPYPSGSPEAAEWDAGWEAAADQADEEWS